MKHPPETPRTFQQHATEGVKGGQQIRSPLYREELASQAAYAYISSLAASEYIYIYISGLILQKWPLQGRSQERGGVAQGGDHPPLALMLEKNPR